MAQKVIDIYPVKNSRRILANLADILLCFIASVAVFELIEKPISEFTPGVREDRTTIVESEKNRCEILYDNNLLYFDETEKHDLQKNVATTGDKFLEFYAADDISKTTDVVYHYFVEMRGEDVTKVNEMYLKYGEKYYDSTLTTAIGTYALKPTMKGLFAPKFDPTNELSENGKTEYTNFINNVFLSVYSEVMVDIRDKNDVKSTLNSTIFSFQEETSKIVNAQNHIKRNYIIMAYVAFFTTAIVFYLVIPMINHKGQTLSELIMKMDRVDIKTIEYIPRKKRYINTLLNLLEGSSIVFGIPILTLGFGSLFSLPELYIVSVVGIIFFLAEIVLILSGKYNQSVKEITTSSIVCDSQIIDEYYKEKYNGRWYLFCKTNKRGRS